MLLASRANSKPIPTKLDAADLHEVGYGICATRPTF